jgi:CheY-like chemotaxis protein
MAQHDASARPALVLLVDTCRDDLEMYGHALTSEGFVTRCAIDIGTALSIAAVERPDVIVTDVHVPGLGGYVLLDSIGAEPRTRGIPVVVLTADGTRVARERALAFRPAEFHVKPLVPELLVAAVRRVLVTEPHVS